MPLDWGKREGADGLSNLQTVFARTAYMGIACSGPGGRRVGSSGFEGVEGVAILLSSSVLQIGIVANDHGWNCGRAGEQGKLSIWSGIINIFVDVAFDVVLAADVVVGVGLFLPMLSYRTVHLEAR